MSDQIFTYDVRQNLTPNTFIKTGYSFTNWNTKSNNSGTSYTNNASVNNLSAINNDTITLYAQWAPNVYDIILNHNDGSSNLSTIYLRYDTNWLLNSSDTIGINNIINLPVRPGYKFLGYYDNNDNQVIDENGGIVVFTNHFSENTTITAKWKLNGFVYICIDPDNNKWEKAIPYVYTKNNNDELEWQPTTPYIYTNSKWTICGN